MELQSIRLLSLIRVPTNHFSSAEQRFSSGLIKKNLSLLVREEVKLYHHFRFVQTRTAERGHSFLIFCQQFFYAFFNVPVFKIGVDIFSRAGGHLAVVAVRCNGFR